MTELQYWVAVLSPVFTFVLALLGWWFVYSNTNRIAKRSEFFALVGKAVDKVVALDRRCADYWLGGPVASSVANSWVAGTLSEINGIRALLDLLEKHHGFRDKSKHVAQLRSSSTLNAEYLGTLSLADIDAQRREQVIATGDALSGLYSYYRSEND